MADNSKEKNVIDNLDKIKEWLGQGLSMKTIAKNLGVSRQTLYKYLAFDNLDTVKKSRLPAVENLENTMYTSALGYTKTVKKHQKLKYCDYENGKKVREWEELVEYEEEVFYPPDTTAGIFLLKNWGEYMNEPKAMEIRKKELELREKQVDATVW